MFSVHNKLLNHNITNYETLYRTAHSQNLDLRERIMQLEAINFNLRAELQTSENHDRDTELAILKERNAELRHKILMLNGTQM